MRYTTKTEYAILCMIYIARHPDASYVTIKEIVTKENYPLAYIEKILQALRQAKLVVSHQGNRGGYVLARKPSEITLKEIIEAIEGATFEAFCEPTVREDIVCTHFCLCGVKPVWRRTKEILDNFYDSITLGMMLKNELEVKRLMTSAAGAEK